MNEKIAGKFKDSIGGALDKADKENDDVLSDAALFWLLRPCMGVCVQDIILLR